MPPLGELALISDYLVPLARSKASLGLRDDAALLTDLPPTGLVVTTDALVAGVHFFADDDPGDAAYKALATNVSDLAAKAARPLAYTMTLALPEGPSEAWAQRFAYGLSGAQTKFGIDLIGGDTVTTPGPWWISITALGIAGDRGIISRSNGKTSDLLYVTGTIGDAALGLRVRKDRELLPQLNDKERNFLLARYLSPEPRLSLREALTQFATAAMDISDGLALDLSRLCAASNLAAEVSVVAIPLSDAARHALRLLPEALRWIVSGGDDYEILAAIPEVSAAAFEASANKTETSVTRIGVLVSGSGPPRFLNADGSELTLGSLGYEHFRAKVGT